MATLPTELRTKLQRTIIRARDIAEDGSRAALQVLAVHHYEPYSHMSPDERKLRNRLRVHGRQLGDKRDPNSGQQSIDHLVNECAYEHWHRMLFARFLAENDLLIEPEMGVAISLDECEELAKEAGTDKWTLASRYAQQMLPQIFRPDNPVLQIRLAREHQLQLEQLLDGLEPAVFIASDSLGWVYQFWQSKKKDEVNKSEVKIGADELPVVTQLFTEPYMVKFLLHNTIGAWYAGKFLARNPEKAQSIEDEDQLRKAVSIPGCDWEYLRFIRTENGKGPWMPAAGIFEGWPGTAAELKVIDPCCGSGHFLVEAFHLLVPIRMEEEALSAGEAVDAVLHENLHGLEIDPRCIEIAAFVLALAAWTYTNTSGYRELPQLSLACSGLALSARREDWLSLSGDNQRLREGMNHLFDLFNEAPTVGSLINPALSIDLDVFSSSILDLEPFVKQALAQEDSFEYYESGIVARGLTLAANFLSEKYHLVVTNVPYLTRQKQIETLRAYCEQYYKDTKADIATAFIARGFEFASHGGTIAYVTPNNWLFLPAYKRLRHSLLVRRLWHIVARIGPGGFETIGGHVVNVALLAISNDRPGDTRFATIDVWEEPQPQEKALGLQSYPLNCFSQADQDSNPDSRIILEELPRFPLLQVFAESRTGTRTGDNCRFLRCFWELWQNGTVWTFMQSTVRETALFAGREHVIKWEAGNGDLAEFAKIGIASIQGQDAWGHSGIAVSLMSNLSVTLYTGEKYDMNCGVIWPRKSDDLLALWAFCSSPEFSRSVRRIDQQLKLTTATLLKIPIDIEYWREIARKSYSSGLPKPYSEDPTQWIYEGTIIHSTDPLAVAVARFLGYSWPEQVEDGLGDLIDEDGIVCIPSVRGEPPATEGLRELLGVVYGDFWSPAKERELIKATGSNANSLDEWLRNDLFAQHCTLFHHRPFIWHIWDGRKRDGFHALVNYHKLAAGDGQGHKLLEKLTNSYLGDWIIRQQDGIDRGIAGAEDRLVAALELKKRLEAILKGERPYDIFVRWKPLAEQPIGWDPDINDGVHLNIRPFMASDIPGGRKGAGILRSKPNIKWGTDRGKEPMRDEEQFPWFWKVGEFAGERVNDVHLRLEEKRQARAEAQEAVQ